jgi:hypothetical protein
VTRSPGSAGVTVGMSAVIVAVTREVPRILTVRWSGGAGADAHASAGDRPATDAGDALPFGPLETAVDPRLEAGLRRWVRERSRLDLGYVEQLYTFGDRFRDPAELHGGPRAITVAYLALVREQPLSGAGDALWRDVYAFLPWEDWRGGRPAIIAGAIAGFLDRWVADAPDEATRGMRRDRADIAFGAGGAPWDMARVLERYELLYEVGAVTEAHVDAALRGRGIGPPAGTPGTSASPAVGLPMVLDHRRILATAIGRLRGKLSYRPLVFDLLPSEFTLLQLQRVVEALAGVRLHQGNFRRLLDRGGLVEGTGHLTGTGGRPAELFRFRPEVLREHVAPGVGLPGIH